MAYALPPSKLILIVLSAFQSSQHGGSNNATSRSLGSNNATCSSGADLQSMLRQIISPDKEYHTYANYQQIEGRTNNSCKHDDWLNTNIILNIYKTYAP